jgi:hypothetical protein
MNESHSNSSSTYVTLLTRAKEIAASINVMRGPGEFGSQKMYDLQNELSEILAQLSVIGAREDKTQSSRASYPGTNALRMSA